MVYCGLAPELADLLTNHQHKCAVLKSQVSQQEDSLRRFEHEQEESQSFTGQARYFMSHYVM